MFKLFRNWPNKNSKIKPKETLNLGINNIENKIEEKRIVKLPTIEYFEDVIYINIPELLSLNEWVDNVNKEIKDHFTLNDFDSNNFGRQVTISPQKKYIVKRNNITFSINLYSNNIIIDKSEIINDEVLQKVIIFNDKNLSYSEFIHTLELSTKSAKVFNSIGKDESYGLPVEKVKEQVHLIIEELKNYQLLNNIVSGNEYIKRLNNL